LNGINFRESEETAQIFAKKWTNIKICSTFSSLLVSIISKFYRSITEAEALHKH